MVYGVAKHVNKFIMWLHWKTANLIYELFIPCPLDEYNPSAFHVRGNGVQPGLLVLPWTWCARNIQSRGFLELVYH